MSFIDNWINIKYNRILDNITSEVYQKLKTINELGLENIIDNVLIDMDKVDKIWFYKYKLQPYLLERFRYHMDEKDKIFIIPTGLDKPVKVVIEGPEITEEETQKFMELVSEKILNELFL